MASGPLKVGTRGPAPSARSFFRRAYYPGVIQKIGMRVYSYGLPVKRRTGPRLTMPPRRDILVAGTLPAAASLSPLGDTSSSLSPPRTRLPSSSLHADRGLRHPFAPILFHGARFSLSSFSPPSPSILLLDASSRHRATRVFNLVHLIVGHRGCVCTRATCSYLGLTTTIDNVVTIATTRTLLSPYANELLIFRASDFFFFFFFLTSFTPPSGPSPDRFVFSSISALLAALYHLLPFASPLSAVARDTAMFVLLRIKRELIRSSFDRARLNPLPSRYPNFSPGPPPSRRVTTLACS